MTLDEVPRNDPARAIAWAREHRDKLESAMIAVLLQLQDAPNPELAEALWALWNGDNSEHPF